MHDSSFSVQRIRGEEARGHRCTDSRFRPSYSVIHNDVLLANSLAIYPVYVCEE